MQSHSVVFASVSVVQKNLLHADTAIYCFCVLVSNTVTGTGISISLIYFSLAMYTCSNVS